MVCIPGGDQKKALTLGQKRLLDAYLASQFRVSERRACGLIGLARASYRYRSQAKDQTPLRMRIKELASMRVRYGYLRIHTILRREGWYVNHKRVHRLYC